ncbi:Disintegrin and metalloproteinase domain-containing protein 22 [Homalodisca vitripennis]|nr:Disintegrin and metalloproteinase domain-containing protein 22 [Homalodisca vitripennis]
MTPTRGEEFTSGEAGMSVEDTVCTAKSVGISVDVNPYELHLLAGTMAHMIGHNIGMGHDGGREECHCRDWHGCIMAQSIVGLENVQPYKFSECSRSDYNSALRTGRGICLLNKPNEARVQIYHLRKHIYPEYTSREYILDPENPAASNSLQFSAAPILEQWLPDTYELK